eukprot:611600-Pleurochrysis_carterae.AAC.6
MMHRRGGKREKGRMELNIGVESGRYEEYIYRNEGQTPGMGAGPLRLTSSQEELLPYHTIHLLNLPSIPVNPEPARISNSCTTTAIIYSTSKQADDNSRIPSA